MSNEESKTPWFVLKKNTKITINFTKIVLQTDNQCNWCNINNLINKFLNYFFAFFVLFCI